MLGLVLRGVCLMRPGEIDWMFRGGCSALQPKAWLDFLALLAEEERADPVAAYHRRMTGDDADTRSQAVRAELASLFSHGMMRSPHQDADATMSLHHSLATPVAGRTAAKWRIPQVGAGSQADVLWWQRRQGRG